MRRVLFTILSVLSLLLFIASVTLWVRSYHPDPSFGGRDPISFTHHEPLWWIISHPGRCVLCRQVGKNWEPHELRGAFHFAGISFGGAWGDDGSSLWNLIVPYWMIATLTIVLPMARVESWRRNRRRDRRGSSGLCANCGYDLRATPERCPECGMAVAENPKDPNPKQAPV